jgi:hypothetical protein
MNGHLVLEIDLRMVREGLVREGLVRERMIARRVGVDTDLVIKERLNKGLGCACSATSLSLVRAHRVK